MSLACQVCQCTEEWACEGGCAWREGFAAAGLAVCTRCVVELKLPPVPNIANKVRKLHWAIQHKERVAWQQRALTLEPWLRGKRPRRPLERVRIEPTFLRATGRPMDDDNAAAALKWALDLLKLRDWIVDDSARHVELVLPVRQVLDKHKEPRLYLTIADLVPLPAVRRPRRATA